MKYFKKSQFSTLNSTVRFHFKFAQLNRRSPATACARRTDTIFWNVGILPQHYTAQPTRPRFVRYEISARHKEINTVVRWR